MRSLRVAAWAGVVACLIGSSAPSSMAQGRRSGGPDVAIGQVALGSTNGDPMGGPVVTGAPFSADANTIVVQTLGDGTRIEQRSTAKFYRDGTGRVRREQTIIGLDTVNPSAEPQTVVSFDSVPGDTMPYVLDPLARTARRMPRALVSSPFGGYLSGVSTFRMRSTRGDLVDAVINAQGLNLPRRGVPNDLRPTEEQLGTRQIDGIKATGRRVTTTIPQGRIGNDRPIQITDEQWDSPELRVVIQSRYSDPRTGVVEYKLTNITRSEPRTDLFVVPADYTVPQVPTAPTYLPFGRGRNPGGNATPGTRGGRAPQ
jgi:hypothetical protein